MNPLVELVFGPLLTVHQWLYEHSDGRIGASLGGRPMLLLRTVGRRTKQPRSAALLYVRDGDAYVVIASKAARPTTRGGSTTSPPIPTWKSGWDASASRACPCRRGQRALPTLGTRRRGQPGPVCRVPVPHEPRDPGRGDRTHAIEAFGAYVRERGTGPEAPTTADEMRQAANRRPQHAPMVAFRTASPISRRRR